MYVSSYASTILSLWSLKTVSTLPAIILLDKVGRRPLLMFGATGCFGSLIIVGSLIAAYGDDWPSHAVAGRVAIG